MANRLYDAFNRNSGSAVAPMGTSDSGHVWEILSTGVPTGVTSVGVASNKAYLSDLPTLTLATLDAGVEGQDGVLSSRLVGPGAGLGLAFRAASATDYWAAHQRVYLYTYQSGTETYVSSYEQVISHYADTLVGYTPKEYLWRLNLPTGVTHGYSDLYGLHYKTKWSRSPTSNPFTSSDTSLSHNHYLYGSYYPGDLEAHSHSTSVSRAFYTNQVRGGDPIYESRPVYVSQPVYSTRPIFSTATGYQLRVTRVEAGISTLVVNRAFSGPATKLQVSLDGAGVEIQAQASQPFAPIVVSDTSTLASNTKHGLLLVRSTAGDDVATDPTTNFIDDFTFNPAFVGSLQPPVLL